MSGSGLLVAPRAEVGLARTDLPVLDDVVAVGAVRIGARAGVAARAVAVAVLPVAVLPGSVQRVVVVGEADRHPLHVAARAELQRRPGVAEQVVGQAEARRDVEPVGQVRDLVEVPVRHPASRRRRVRVDLAVEPFQANARAERQPVERPRVLGEQADVAVEAVAVDERRIGDPDLLGNARAVVLAPDVGVVDPGPGFGPEAVLDAHLEVVRAGDVGQLGRQHVALRHLPEVELRVAGPLDADRFRVEARDDRVPGMDVADLVGIELQTGRREAGPHAGRAVLRQPRLRTVVVVDPVGRPADLREQPAADGRRPLHLRGVARAVLPEPAALTHRLDVLARGVVVARELVVAVVPHRDLVVSRALDGEPQVVAVDLTVVDARRPVAIEAVEHDPVADSAMARVEEPHAILDDGAAERSVHLVRPVDAVHGGDALVREPRGQVRRREVPVHRLVVEGAGDLVAAFPRNHGDPHAAGGRLRVGPARLDRHLVREGVVQVVLRPAVAAEAVDQHAVDRDAGVVVVESRGLDVMLIHRARAPDVQRRLDARHQRDPRLPAPARGDGVDDIAGDHLRALRLLHVDERRFTRHRDGLLEGADPHLHVDRHGEVRRQRELVAKDGGEAGKGERHLVGAGAQVDDAVPALAVGDGDAPAFDEHRTAGLDGDARQHAAGVVRDLADDPALAVRGCRQQRDGEQDDHGPSENALPFHADPPSGNLFSWRWLRSAPTPISVIPICRFVEPPVRGCGGDSWERPGLAGPAGFTSPPHGGRYSVTVTVTVNRSREISPPSRAVPLST